MNINSAKVAIITGSSGGIGKAVTLRLLEDCWNVYGLDVTDDEFLMRNKYFKFLKLDLTNLDDLANITTQIVLSKKENLLLNCAGIREICSIDDLSIDLWGKIIQLNVTSVFYLSKLIEKKARDIKTSLTIINIASVSGLIGEPDRTAYVTSKHAVLGLTKQMAIEYGKYGVRVNAISPGVIRTPLTEHYFHDPKQLKKIQAGQFIERIGSTEDVANAVIYLASDQASFVTGSNFIIDGGWSVGKPI